MMSRATRWHGNRLVGRCHVATATSQRLISPWLDYPLPVGGDLCERGHYQIQFDELMLRVMLAITSHISSLPCAHVQSVSMLAQHWTNSCFHASVRRVSMEPWFWAARQKVTETIMIAITLTMYLFLSHLCTICTMICLSLVATM